MPDRQRVVLIAAGAGGGIAATFNAPLGGFAFAIELMMVSVSPKALLAGCTSNGDCNLYRAILFWSTCILFCTKYVFASKALG